MEHDWESREFFHNSVENVECQWWWHEAASFWILGALFWSELVSTVACTDRDSERVNASLLSEVDHFFRLSLV